MATYTASTQPETIPHNYIVVFKKDTPHDKCDAHCAWAAEMHSQKVYTADDQAKYCGLQHQYKLPCGWAGYAGSFDQALIEELEATDEVDYVEPDVKVFASQIVTAAAGSWGQARISQRSKLTATTKGTFYYDDTAGEGATVYIVDTGILASHDEFENRATFGHNAVPGSADTDMNGHGTHCAGTIGGKTYGVAKKATLVGIKVLGDDGSGSISSVISGLNWAAEDAQSKGALKKSVASMSLGGGYSKAMNSAVKAIVQAGMTVCVAAGNESRDAATSSPASEPTAVTVGATAIDDSMSSFSNYGKLVDVFAPGSMITSAWIDKSGGGSTSSINTISGTSMATPHISGLSAYLIALEKLEGSAQVTQRIKQLATSGQLTGLKGDSANLLSYNGAQDAASKKAQADAEKLLVDGEKLRQ
ncbi:peptidase S8/S53 domain-containing protein [Sphaerosporella brunnea]|uniref:Peptidase S8/S53 domain-containing protein n=1 Tax=Sphaerosporella brunnea TaxID=1250544 RepID=A0A5J5EJE1_9PEZI|nr:peptidase S8/S53 domain-containing protein [Sphaerosporella brunnea]